MVRNAYGAVEWIEEQKNWIAQLMKLKYDWERLYKGKNQRGDLLLSDYRRERAAEKAELAVKAQEQEENKLKQIQDQAKEETEKTDKKIEEKNKELKRVDDLLWQTSMNQVFQRNRTEKLEERYHVADAKLQDENKSLRDKLEQAYDFMQQFVLGGRNLLDMFKEQIGEVIGWVQEKVGSRSR